MERFYLQGPFTINGQIELKDDEHHHLSHVMRIREKDTVELIDGCGSFAKASVIKIGKKGTVLQILHLEKSPPAKQKVLLGVPFMRPAKLEWVIEKGTEIGADSFLLYKADNSIQQSLSDHQLSRLKTITISATKQSQRLYLPHLEILPHLSSLLKKQAQILFGDLDQKTFDWKQNTQETTLFISGPEKGFSENEVKQLREAGLGVRINPHILRAETAPIVAISLLIN